MGVVTDVTVKGLTTAVTNISATGMSDTTGQAIVTAINNLSGSISPAASNVTFNNTGTDLTSSNVEGAIKEIAPSMIKKIEDTFPSGATSTTISYPSGKTKDNMYILAVAFYRNNGWVYLAVSYNITLRTTDISLELLSGYTYFAGLPYRIIYR